MCIRDRVLKESDWIIEMGPEAGANGGYVIAEGTIGDIEKNEKSMIGEFLSDHADTTARKRCSSEDMFSIGKIHLSTDKIHTVKSLEVDIPKGRLTVVTGVSGSGKTTLILESLIPVSYTHLFRLLHDIYMIHRNVYIS